MSDRDPSAPGPTMSEIGRRGGEAIARKRGPEWYQAIGRKGGRRTAETHGPEHYRRMAAAGASKGGQATLARYGAEHMAAAGRKGGARLSELAAAGRAALAAEATDVEDAPCVADDAP